MNIWSNNIKTMNMAFLGHKLWLRREHIDQWAKGLNIEIKISFFYHYHLLDDFEYV